MSRRAAPAPFCWCPGLCRPKSLAEHSHHPMTVRPGVPFKSSGLSTATSNGITSQRISQALRAASQSAWEMLLFLFAESQMLTFDLFLSSSGPQTSDDSYFISFSFLFFPCKKEKSGGLRKVVNILEGLLHVSYWDANRKI